MILDSSDFFIPRMPKCVDREETANMFKDIPESVKEYARTLRAAGWKFYVVRQNRGYCDYSSRVITIPSWAHNHRDFTERIWYISHELAHAHNKKHDQHGPGFMETLKKICPADCIHHELSYKPRNAAAAGISKPQIGLIDL